ncbi:MAG: hypothetical protein IT383_24835 [Deltaproteobacteria bacterium]|nr:hypothetical protein [Deltaproteobacteria bacterium]
MADGVFTNALRRLDLRAPSFFGPRSFREYVREVGQYTERVDTARYISVDHLEDLDPELRAAEAMVLRLGASTTEPGTQFGLARVPGGLRDFFVFDEAEPTEHLDGARAKSDDLLAFSLLGKLSETSLVSLGFSSGLIGRALGVDGDARLPAPATGASTFTFSFRAHSSLTQELAHVRGQVQVDAIFSARRHGELTLFVIEAKARSARRNLAKHKLLFPMLAIASRVPKDVAMVPVAVFADEVGEGRARFRIIECSCPDPRGQDLVALDELRPTRVIESLLDYY